MKLRTRFAVILGGFALVLIALSVAMTQVVFVRQALSRDRQGALAAHALAQQLLQAEHVSLLRTAQAWAAHAATARCPPPTTLADDPETHTPGRAWQLDARGQPLPREVADTDTALIRAWREPQSGLDLTRAPDDPAGSSGLLAVGDTLWLIATARSPADGREAPRGLLLCRPLDAAAMARLKRLSGCDLSLHATPLPTPDTGVHGVRTTDPHTLDCFTTLTDWHGAPTLLLHTRVPRDAFSHSLFNLVYLAAWILFCGLVVSGFAFWTLDRWVLRSVTRSAQTLRDGIAALATTGEERPRLKGIEPGAMGELAVAINAMLDAFAQAEQEAARRRSEAVQAQKLASLGTLVAGVAHEVNNPNGIVSLNMNVLRRLLERLDERLEAHGSEAAPERHPDVGALTREAREAVDETLAASLRIAAFVSSLRNFALPAASGPTARIDVNAAARNAGEWLRHELARHRCRLELALAENLPAIRGDSLQLQQVLVNLLQNACQATPPEGAPIRVASALDAARRAVTLTVSDQGKGLSAEDLDRVMDPFYTTRRGEGGSGLGLSISAAIVKAHGGTLSLTSEPGTGTTATISLPLAGEGNDDGKK